jgi:hypothetical protein
MLLQGIFNTIAPSFSCLPFALKPFASSLEALYGKELMSIL